jgi:transcriptional regulator with XRE-family HTH domain
MCDTSWGYFMIEEKVIEGLREYLLNNYIPKTDNGLFAADVRIMGLQKFDKNTAFLKEPVYLRNISDEVTAFIKKNKKPEGFAHTLDRIRKEKGLTAAELYKRANVDRRQYSRFMGPERRHPSVNTVISFALALRLERPEFDEFLQTAGYALSNSSSRDVCIMFCLENSIYEIDDVNALLFAVGITPLTRE